MNLLKPLLAILALCFWFSSFFLWRYYDAHAPREDAPGSLRTYPLETHGSVVYLTASEHFLLYGLMLAGILCFVLTALLAYVGLRRG